MAGKPTSTEAERFWAKVDATPNPSACWSWKAAVNAGGYGVMRRTSQRKMVRATTVSWEIHFGPIPRGLVVCHACDNPICSNPNHLLLGTLVANNIDMWRKGRYARGEKSGHAKLSEADVRQIHERARNGEKKAEIARSLGISPASVTLITKGKNWAHVAADLNHAS